MLFLKELPLCHRYYSPTPEEVEWAEEMIRLTEESISEGKGVAVKDNKFTQERIKKNELCNLH